MSLTFRLVWAIATWHQLILTVCSTRGLYEYERILFCLWSWPTSVRSTWRSAFQDIFNRRLRLFRFYDIFVFVVEDCYPVGNCFSGLHGYIQRNFSRRKYSEVGATLNILARNLLLAISYVWLKITLFACIWIPNLPNFEPKHIRLTHEANAV